MRTTAQASTNDLPGHVQKWPVSAYVLLARQAMYTLVMHQATCTFRFAAGQHWLSFRSVLREVPMPVYRHVCRYAYRHGRRYTIAHGYSPGHMNGHMHDASSVPAELAELGPIGRAPSNASMAWLDGMARWNG